MTVTGTVPLAAAAADQVGVWKVDFQVDGVTKGNTTIPPYSYPWSSSQVTNGNHTLTALVTDYAGNTATSSAVVNVQNNGTAAAPGAPTLNSATAGSASVTLNWSAPASDGGSALTGYRVYRSSSSGAETLLATVGLGTSYTDTGLTNGSTYFYKVSAVNGVGESGLSSERSAIPAGTPGAPALNAATPSNTMLTLTWTPPSGNGSAVTGYRVYRSTSSGTESLYTTIPALTAFTDTGLTNGTTYYYKLTALNAIGESGLSNERTRHTRSDTGRAHAQRSHGRQRNRRPELGDARRQRQHDHGLPRLPLHQQRRRDLADHARARQQLHRHQARERHHLLLQGHRPQRVGESGLSESVRHARSGGERSRPARAEQSDGRQRHRRPHLDDAERERQRTRPATASTAPPAAAPRPSLTTLGLVNSYTDTGLTNGTTYYYKVTALNAVGESSLCSERSAAPRRRDRPARRPSTRRPPATGSVSLSWTTPSANGSPHPGYRLYRSTSSGAETLSACSAPSTATPTPGSPTAPPTTTRSPPLNAVGESTLSNERSRPTAPGAPGRADPHARPPATAASASAGRRQRQRRRRSPATASTAPPAAATRPS